MLLKDVKNIKEVVLTGNDLSLEELVAVSRYDAKIKVDPDAIDLQVNFFSARLPQGSP